MNTYGKGVALLFFVVILLFGSKADAQHGDQKKPNIIFILTDDQGYGDLGVFFQNQRKKDNDRSKPYESSPYLDRLAMEGAMLTQHYSAAPVCAPSRASLLLGVSQGHANVRDNQFDKALEDNYTMASTLRKLGYSTAAIGKWGLQGDKRWDADGASWPARPRNRGFDYFFGYMRHSDGHEHYPKEGLYRKQKEVWDNGMMITPELDKCYTADLWTAVAKKYIVDHEKGKEKDKPFFMYLAFDTPHAVLELPTQKYPSGGGLHGGLQWIGTPGHMINTASGKPDSWMHPDYAQATYDDDHNAATPEAPWPDTYKRYATANRRIDHAVGDLVQLLKDLHIDSTTLIVYTSDNGPSIESYLPKGYVPNHPTFFGSYGPFDGIKRDCWEGGVRMPAIAWWPGHIPAGEVITDPSISYDWAPTFTEAAGMPAPAHMDGVSLLPSLTGAGLQRHPLIYIEYYHPGKTPDFKAFAPARRDRRRNQMQLIRMGDYVGVRYDVQSAADSFEIYNVVTDPGERENLTAATNDKKVTVERMAAFNAQTTGPVTIGKLETFMQSRVLQVRRPDTSAARPYDDAPVPAVQQPEEMAPGVNWKQYEGVFPWIPQVAELKPSAAGHTRRPDISTGKHQNNTVLFFDGYIRVPRDGNYTFSLKSRAKALLRIHDAVVIDADHGYSGNVVREGAIRLRAGLHPFRLYYKKKDGKNGPADLEWSGPGIAKQPVPAGAFFRAP